MSFEINEDILNNNKEALQTDSLSGNFQKEFSKCKETQKSAITSLYNFVQNSSPKSLDISNSITPSFSSFQKLPENPMPVSRSEPVEKLPNCVIKAKVVPTSHPVGPTRKKSFEEKFLVKNLQTNETTVKSVSSKTKIQPVFGYESVRLVTKKTGPFPVVYMGPPNIVDMQSYRKMVEKENQQKLNQEESEIKSDSKQEGNPKTKENKIASSKHCNSQDKLNIRSQASVTACASLFDVGASRSLNSAQVSSFVFNSSAASSLPENTVTSNTRSLKSVLDNSINGLYASSKKKRNKYHFDLEPLPTLVSPNGGQLLSKPFLFNSRNVPLKPRISLSGLHRTVAVTKVTDSRERFAHPARTNYIPQVLHRFSPTSVVKNRQNSVKPFSSSTSLRHTFTPSISMACPSKPHTPLNNQSPMPFRSILPRPLLHTQEKLKRKPPSNPGPAPKKSKIEPAINSSDQSNTNQVAKPAIIKSPPVHNLSEMSAKDNSKTQPNLLVPVTTKKDVPVPSSQKKTSRTPIAIAPKRPGVLVKFEDNVQLWVDKLRDLTYLDDEPVKSWNLKKGIKVAAKYTDGLFYDAVVLTSYEGSSANQSKEENSSPKSLHSKQSNIPKEIRKKPSDIRVKTNSPKQPKHKSLVSSPASLPRVHIKKLQLVDGEDCWDANLIDLSSDNLTKLKSKKEILKVKCPNCFLVFRSVSLFRRHQKTVCGSKGITVSDFEFEEGVEVKVDESEVPPLVSSYSKIEQDKTKGIPRDSEGKRCFRRGSHILHRWQTDLGSKWFHGRILRLLVSSKTKRCDYEIEYEDDDQEGGPIRLSLYDDYPHDIRVVTR